MIIDIAIARTRLAKKWINKSMTWGELVEKCRQTTRTPESVAEYARMSKDEQGRIKDCGGFVGGYIRGGERKKGNVLYRSILTLDIDFGNPSVWEDFIEKFGCAAFIYSTHKYGVYSYRYRLVILLSRRVNADEYEPICRKIASETGINMYDITTYQMQRLFYWPSTSRDGEFVFEEQQGNPLDVDEILSTYRDYRDVSSWPLGDKEKDIVREGISRQEDPTEKRGIIGLFCRAYSIEDAIEELLPDEYEKTAMEGRYTYKKGTMSGGLVCYEHKYAYSHHESDPSSGMLCNAFDLVRIHKFGLLDSDKECKDTTKCVSFKKMSDFASKDEAVRRILGEEREEEYKKDFADIWEYKEDDDKEQDKDFIRELEVDGKGNYKSTRANVIKILEHDKAFKGKLYYDEFSGYDIVVGGLPWNKKAEQWTKRDDANLRTYLDGKYHIQGKDVIKDATISVLTAHRKHPVRDYFNSLKWDGIERLDTIFIYYLGAEDNELNRAVARKFFTAAVARCMTPGCKFDYCPIIQGAEGICKSTLFAIMAGDWFNDSLSTMDGKASMEQIAGSLINELAELSSMKRCDVEQIKNYISRRSDEFRGAYRENVEDRKRQGVFCGTTNEDYFLKGDYGNRRFWIVPVYESSKKEGYTMQKLKEERDQLWAEAVYRWKKGEKLYLEDDMEERMREKQVSVNDNVDDPTKLLLEDYLSRKLPVDWNTWDKDRRRAWMQAPDPNDAIGVVERTEFSKIEFIYEILKKDVSDKDYRWESRKIAKLIEDFPAWDKGSTYRISAYGIQRVYKKIQ